MKVFANKRTKVYHADNKRGDACRQSLMLRKNVEKFLTPFDAELMGYRACKRCKPE